MMYKVEAIIREEKLEDIKAALHEIEINGVTAYQVMGFGAQHGYTTVVRGQEVDAMLLPKIKLEIVVSSGEMGDGKIFAYEITDAVKIRTGESGYDALQSSSEDTEK